MAQKCSQKKSIVGAFSVNSINFGKTFTGGYKSVHKYLFRSGSAIAVPKTSCRKFLERLDCWDFDVLTLAEMTNGKPLNALVASIFQKRAISTEFKIPKNTLKNFLDCLEDQYDDKVAYHNSSHAADVTHCVHVLLSSPALEGTFTQLEIFAALFAAAISDVGHPGWSNDFFARVYTGKKDATEGGKVNRSYLEERHLLMAFQILECANRNILCGLDASQLKYFKKLVTDMVLATDMARHADLMTRTQRLIQQQKQAETQRSLCLQSYEEKITVLQFLLHCADLSNSTKRFQIYERFVGRLFKELFELGDHEKLLDFPVSPNCDRRSTNVPKTQVSFITHIAQPLWNLWHELVMDDASDAILNTIKFNLNEWNQKELMMLRESIN